MYYKKFISILSLFHIVIQVNAQISIADFQNPPLSARPRVWWHWMNGNITKEGIQKDFEWMKKAGIGGVHNFDANLFTPLVVKEKLVYMTPKWKEAFKFATDQAIEKNLELTIAGSPGWSVTGGPWVKPEDAMKKYVFTETSIKGGQRVNQKLPMPPNNVGKFQSSVLGESFLGGFVGDKPTFYHDVSVIAYKLPYTEKTFKSLNPKITTSGGAPVTIEDLTDGDILKSFYLDPMEVGKDMFIQFEFERPVSFKAISLVGASHVGLEEFNGGPTNRTLKASDDGINFRDVTIFEGSTVPQITKSFTPTSAKFWRLCYTTLPPEMDFVAALAGLPQNMKAKGVDIAEVELHTTDRIDQWQDKAGFSPWKESELDLNKSTDEAIPFYNIIDITDKMQEDGTLNWEVPLGDWNVIRFGYSLTGRQNHPASPEATGLEVDKLDKDAVTRYINHYLDLYRDATGNQMGAKGLQYMVLDSYEAGHMNWTKLMAEEFYKRRGYSITPWIVALVGRVVNSREATEKFLWDFRKTIGEMISEYHYDAIGDELYKRGMKRYTESHENKRIFLADGMDVKRKADIPMSAMWTPGSLAGTTDEEPRSEADIRESASVANIYGKPIVAAESMTSVGKAFVHHPGNLKRTADLEMASGLNRFVIHTSVHQPLDDKKPGFSLGPFGQYFTRQETWAEQSKAWVDYLSRSCHMLQQGKNVADILYYYGENQNITSVCELKLPEIPKGFEFDFVNSTALLEAISVKDGQLMAQSGNTYKVLKIDSQTKYISVPVLYKIKSFVDAGVKLIGNRPISTPTLSDDINEFKQLVQTIWSDKNVVSFPSLHLTPDVQIENTDSKILFRHRTVGESDIYWLNSRSDKASRATISFRVKGKVPELWNAMNGTIQKISYSISGEQTTCNLRFDPWDAYFVVFKDKTIIPQVSLPNEETSIIATFSSPWKINFGAKQISADKLQSWSDYTESDVKYFSGTATYENTFKLNSVNTKKSKYSISMAEVNNMAEVILNGKSAGITWKSPYAIDITNQVLKGDNKIQIKVTNTWVNRLVGDAQPGAIKTTFTTMPFYSKDSPLLPAGIIGDIKVFQSKYK